LFDIHATEVIRDIWDAFKDVPRPQKSEILDSKDLNIESIRILEFLNGKLSKNLSWDNLREYPYDASAILTFLSPIAFRYFIPSFLIMCIANAEEIDVIFNSAIYRLMPPSVGDPGYDILSERFDNRKIVFSPFQAAAICRALRFLLSEEYQHLGFDREISKCLEGHWGKFC
jgi:hypothetical protein